MIPWAIGGENDVEDLDASFSSAYNSISIYPNTLKMSILRFSCKEKKAAFTHIQEPICLKQRLFQLPTAVFRETPSLLFSFQSVD